MQKCISASPGNGDFDSCKKHDPVTWPPVMQGPDCMRLCQNMCSVIRAPSVPWTDRGPYTAIAGKYLQWGMAHL